MRETHRSLAGLLTIKLEALYDVEINLRKAWSSIKKGASHPKLGATIKAAAQQSKRNKTLIEESFEVLGKRPEKLAGEAVRGLINDAKWVIENVPDERARDANLVAAIQYILHYQIAGYGSAHAWAEALKNTDLAQLLNRPLEAAKRLDLRLNTLAASRLNRAVK
jgi:ferritin-like metal-binding protein YciE